MKLTRTTLLTVAVGLVAVATLGVALGLPSWGLLVLIAVLLALAVAAVRDTGNLPSAAADPSPALPADPSPTALTTAPPASRVVYDIPLASAASEYRFSFSARVCWTPIGTPSPSVDLGSAAIKSVLLRAQRELAGIEPTQSEVATYRLGAVLGVTEADEMQNVRAWAERIQVRLPDHYVSAANARGELRRRQEIVELEQSLERQVRTYLKDEALVTPGSATVWWLARYPDQLERCVNLYPTLRRLSDAANDRAEILDEPRRSPGQDSDLDMEALLLPSRLSEPAAPPQVELRAAVENFLDGHNADERNLKASLLAKLEDGFGRTERAQGIRDEFNSASTSQPAEALVDGDSDEGDSVSELDRDGLSSAEDGSADDLEVAETPVAAEPAKLLLAEVDATETADAAEPSQRPEVPAAYREEFYPAMNGSAGVAAPAAGEPPSANERQLGQSAGNPEA